MSECEFIVHNGCSCKSKNPTKFRLQTLPGVKEPMAKLTSDTADKKVGQRIQMRRKETGMTAQQLAERVDISQQQLSRYERGTNKINVSHLVNIAAGLSTPVSWFFIDCQPEFEGVGEEQQEYVPVQDADLKRRLEQIWPRLTREQRRVLILFLDEYA